MAGVAGSLYLGYLVKSDQTSGQIIFERHMDRQTQSASRALSGTSKKEKDNLAVFVFTGRMYNFKLGTNMNIQEGNSS